MFAKAAGFDFSRTALFHHGPVTAFFLGLIQGLVCNLDGTCQAPVRVGADSSDANTYGQEHLSGRGLVRLAQSDHLFTQPVGQRLYMLCSRAIQDQGKLFSAVPGSQVERDAARRMQFHRQLPSEHRHRPGARTDRYRP